jgi:hypothetical protein
MYPEKGEAVPPGAGCYAHSGVSTAGDCPRPSIHPPHSAFGHSHTGDTGKTGHGQLCRWPVIWYPYRFKVRNRRVRMPQPRGSRQIMTRGLHCDTRLLVILVVLCVTVLSQSSALSAPRESHQAPDHCCLLCHVGPLPFLQTSVSTAWAPVFQVVWRASPATFETLADFRLVPCPSRAPPVV